MIGGEGVPFRQPFHAIALHFRPYQNWPLSLIWRSVTTFLFPFLTYHILSPNLTYIDGYIVGVLWHAKQRNSGRLKLAG